MIVEKTDKEKENSHFQTLTVLFSSLRAHKHIVRNDSVMQVL